MIAEILCVGTELLLGQVVNTDAQYLSVKLSEMGIELYRIETVGDNPGRVREAVAQALQRCDMLITTGGLGPTEDDLTKEMVAETLGLEMKPDAAAMAHLEQQFIDWKRPMPENNRKQAWFPEGAHILKNARGTAPGCAVEQGGKIVIVLPGPPYELNDMVDNAMIPYLREKLGYTITSRFVRTYGIGESDLEMRIRDMIDAQGRVTIATYCSMGEAQVRLTVKCRAGEDAGQYLAPVEAELRARLGGLIYAIGETDMPHVVIDMLRRAGRTVATTESCTGGRIADWLVSVPGASYVFSEGHVTYSNDVKEHVLGVKHETLEKYSAVSAQTAREMADGLHRISGADYCVSVTGLAGPDGGTPEKPVGLVYIGLRAPNGTSVQECHFSGDRHKIRTLATLRALNMVREAIILNDKVAY